MSRGFFTAYTPAPEPVKLSELHGPKRIGNFRNSFILNWNSALSFLRPCRRDVLGRTTRIMLNECSDVRSKLSSK